MQPAPGKPIALSKPPTYDTQYHIDYEWWSRTGKDLVQAMIAQLPQALRETLSAHPHESTVDYIDPVTAEVTAIDELTLAIRTAAAAPDFITPQTSITDAMFRIFVANGNQPLSVNELAERLSRLPKDILKILSGRETYYGLRRIS